MRIAYLNHYAERYGANRSLLELRCRGEVEPHVLVPRAAMHLGLVVFLLGWMLVLIGAGG